MVRLKHSKTCGLQHTSLALVLLQNLLSGRMFRHMLRDMAQIVGRSIAMDTRNALEEANQTDEACYGG